MNSDNTKIMVVGVGGSGLNTLNYMINSGISGVDFVAVNCDVQDLKSSLTNKIIHIGRNLTQGLGAGMEPGVGRMAALESQDQIHEVLGGMDLVFITCGLGGGTGTGAAPVVARIAQEKGALVLGVVTTPFSFEGNERARIAEIGLQDFEETADALIVIPNDRLLSIAAHNTSLTNIFAKCDEVLMTAVQAISELIVKVGIINLDFADIQSTLSGAGQAMMGVGSASGQDRAARAARQAINSPLIDVSIVGAGRVLFSVAGGDDLALSEISEAARMITESVDPNARIIFGSFHDENLGKGEMKVIVIAAGFTKLSNKNKKKYEILLPKKKEDNQRSVKNVKEVKNNYSFLEKCKRLYQTV